MSEAAELLEALILWIDAKEGQLVEYQRTLSHTPGEVGTHARGVAHGRLSQLGQVRNAICEIAAQRGFNRSTKSELTTL